MSRYKEISTNNYVVNKLRCACENCHAEFVTYEASNYELVCFELSNGEKRFLLTYGNYGYLDLMEKLVDGWSEGDRITCNISKKFEEAIKGITPYGVSLVSKINCMKCESKNIKVIQRNTVQNADIKWLEIDIEQLKLKRV